MAKQKYLFYLPIILMISIVGIVLYIITNTSSPPISRMVQWIGTQIESFENPTKKGVSQCPPKFRFFNDSRGESMCCAEKVDPYKHTCSAKGTDTLCAFTSGIIDERSSSGKTLPHCNDLKRTIQLGLEKEHCPKSLPNHAEAGRCCKNKSNESTGDCMSMDLKDVNSYCLTTAPRKASQKNLRTNGFGQLIDPDKNTIMDANKIEKRCISEVNKEMLQCPRSDMAKVVVLTNPKTLEQVWACQSSPIMHSAQSGLTIPSGVPGVPAFCYNERGYVGLYNNLNDSDDPRAHIKTSLETYLKSVKNQYMNCDVFKKVFIDGDTTGGPYTW